MTVFFFCFVFNFTEWKFRITVEQTLVESSEFHFPIKEITKPFIYHYCESINLHHVRGSALPRHFIHDAAEFCCQVSPQVTPLPFQGRPFGRRELPQAKIYSGLLVLRDGFKDIKAAESEKGNSLSTKV